MCNLREDRIFEVYDVDHFNVVTVDQPRDLNDPNVIARFEDLRQKWIELATGLPAEAFQNDKITNRLYIEIIGHFDEHRLQEPV